MGFSPNGIAVIASIKAGEEDNCQDILLAINKSQADSIRINFAKNNITHFARFVVIDDHDKGVGRKRLLFSAIFDGNPQDFFSDMRDNTSDIDAIWTHCEGYTGKHSFVQFMLDHNNTTGTFLRGHRYDTVEQIQAYLALRDELAQKFDVPLADYDRILRELPQNPSATIFLRRLKQRLGVFLRSVILTVSALARVVKLLSFGTTLFEALKFIREPLELKRDYTDASIDKSPPCHKFAEGDEVVSQRENDAIPEFLDRNMVQNQMTVLTANDPNTLRLAQTVQAYINLVANLPFINRNNTIPTIHFGRWMMIDNGKRMLFLSNYDGNWQTYIGDFVDKVAAGLNAFWAGSIGWRDATTLDIELFKEGIRCHQTRASFFYSAYPDATVLNVSKARKIYAAYHNNIDENTAKEWLKAL